MDQSLLTSNLSKSKKATFSRRLELILDQLHENVVATREIQKESSKLKRSNDRSFERARKAVEALESR